MEYRINKRTGDKISTLGFGTSYIAETGEEKAVATIRRAYEGGINYFDLAKAHRDAGIVTVFAHLAWSSRHG